MHEVGDSKPVLWDNTEGWGREGGGRRAWDGGGVCAPVADPCQCVPGPPQCWKVTVLQLK